MGCAAFNNDTIRLGSRDASRVPTKGVVEASYAGDELVVLVHDVSSTGIRIETRQPCLEEGDWLRLRLPLVDEQLVQVVWRAETRAGCVFAEPLDPARVRIVAGALQPSEPGEIAA
jgi:hypothetical protein